MGEQDPDSGFLSLLRGFPTQTTHLRLVILCIGARRRWRVAGQPHPLRVTPILFGPVCESLYVHPKESKGFASGARQTNPGFTESRGWQRIPNPGLPT